MITYRIPGKEVFEINQLILDFNGTIATDGKLIPEVRERISQLAAHLTIYVVTADTNGSVYEECNPLPVSVHVIGKEDQAAEKKRFVQSLGAENVAAIGNGVNDGKMFETSKIAIAVIGKEGCSTASLLKSDLVVTNIADGLDLLLNQHRLTATLRS